MTETNHAATTTRAEVQPRLKLPKSVRKFTEVRLALYRISVLRLKIQELGYLLLIQRQIVPW